MSTPRLEVDLEAVRHNARHLVDALAPRGIRVVAVTKAVVAWDRVATALIEAGVAGLGDSRIESLGSLRSTGITTPLTLVRSPMLSQVDAVVRSADVSLNTESVVLEALSAAASRLNQLHSVVVMVELGDLREGVDAVDVVSVARFVRSLPGLSLAGIGTNLACQNGVVPDQAKMDELSGLAEEVEAACGHKLSTVSGGNSASLGWALATDDVGRIDELRLGEAILLGVDPLDRRPIAGLRGDAFRVVAEVIEVATKPTRPWGQLAQTAFGEPRPAHQAAATRRQAILALGRQDVDPAGLTPPAGMSVLGASSDHLVVDLGDHDLAVGDEVTFAPDYSALLRASTSRFVAKVDRASTFPAPHQGPEGSPSSATPQPATTAVTRRSMAPTVRAAEAGSPLTRTEKTT
ncbi:MAG TPA: alanine/ornithine racemase family PLP-dependent enzyme [Acidimicrobiales bacterium]